MNKQNKMTKKISLILSFLYAVIFKIGSRVFLDINISRGDGYLNSRKIHLWSYWKYSISSTPTSSEAPNTEMRMTITLDDFGNS